MALALGLALGIQAFIVKPYQIPSESMEPTLDVGQRVLVNRFLYHFTDPKVGDVVVFHPPIGAERGQQCGVDHPSNRQACPRSTPRRADENFIKRIVAVPGDTLRIEEGQVIVNGHPIDQSVLEVPGAGEIAPLDFPVITQAAGQITGANVPFVNAGPTLVPRHTVAGDYPPAVPSDDPVLQLYFGSTLEALAPLPASAPDGTPFVHELVIPEGHYFVIGDNRSMGGSEDSRLFGPVPSVSIAGRVSAVIWPPRREGQWNWRLLDIPGAFGEIPETGR